MIRPNWISLNNKRIKLNLINKLKDLNLLIWPMRLKVNKNKH